MNSSTNAMSCAGEFEELKDYSIRTRRMARNISQDLKDLANKIENEWICAKTSPTETLSMSILQGLGKSRDV